MKKLPPITGIILIIIGTLALAMTRLSALSSSNALLITGLTLIVAGIWLHIHHIKHESRY